MLSFKDCWNVFNGHGTSFRKQECYWNRARFEILTPFFFLIPGAIRKLLDVAVIVGEVYGNKEMVVQLRVDEGDFSLLGPSTNGGHSSGLYDKPLSCFGCGIGWFS